MSASIGESRHLCQVLSRHSRKSDNDVIKFRKSEEAAFQLVRISICRHRFDRPALPEIVLSCRSSSFCTVSGKELIYLRSTGTASGSIFVTA